MKKKSTLTIQYNFLDILILAGILPVLLNGNAALSCNFIFCPDSFGAAILAVKTRPCQSHTAGKQAGLIAKFSGKD
jgi:hypothetical protein